MRLLYTSLIASSVLLLHYMDNPGLFHRTWESVASKSADLMVNKEIRIEGLKVLPRTEVERVLPKDRSVVWWKMNGTDIRSKVEESPWIEEASVESCPEGFLRGWGCFVVSVKERTPKFIASVDNERWIIGSDGTFIMPSGGPLYGLTADTVSRLVVVEGLASRTHSPDMVRSQLAVTAGSVDTIERAVGRNARVVRLEGRGDVSVIFDGIPFPVVFNASSDSPVPLPEQGVRFVALLSKLKDRYNDVARVDLAFTKVGVVKVRTDEPVSPQVQVAKKS